MTPLSNLVIVGTGASAMYDGKLVDDDDATVAAAAVDIFRIIAAEAEAEVVVVAVVAADAAERLASSWSMIYDASIDMIIGRLPNSR